MCTYNLTKLEDWKIPCYTFGKELRKNLAINEESLKYNKGISKLRLDMDNINSTKTPKWSLYKIDRFINNKNLFFLISFYLIHILLFFLSFYLAKLLFYMIKNQYFYF